MRVLSKKLLAPEFKTLVSTYSRVLQLMNLTDGRLAQAACCDKLEMALLSFFEQFRKIYIGDQVQKTSKVYRRLSEVLGLNDEAMVLSVIIRKVIQFSVSASCSNLLSTFTQEVLDLDLGRAQASGSLLGIPTAPTR